jgi:hypothetical protein
MLYSKFTKLTCSSISITVIHSFPSSQRILTTFTFAKIIFIQQPSYGQFINCFRLFDSNHYLIMWLSWAVVTLCSHQSLISMLSYDSMTKLSVNVRLYVKATWVTEGIFAFTLFHASWHLNHLQGCICITTDCSTYIFSAACLSPIPKGYRTPITWTSLPYKMLPNS